MGRASYIRRPLPRDVPGFGEAVRLGLVPAVPPTPPALVCPPSYRGVVQTAVLVGLAMVAVIVLPSWWALGIVPVTVVGFLRMVRTLRERERLEVAAGYRLVEWRAGTWGRDPDGRFAASTGLMAAPWDLRGLWHLDARGDVVAPPDPSVLPPGHYPSPNRPGQLEMWTGAAWMYDYRIPERPFLVETGSQG